MFGSDTSVTKLSTQIYPYIIQLVCCIGYEWLGDDMSGANFISEPVISFSITSISSRWYVLVIFNVDIRQNENYSSGSAHPHPTYSDPDHKYTHFSYANICFRTYDHTSFLAPVFCIRYVSLIGTLFFWIRYLGAEYMLYHLGGISIMCRYF